MKLSAVAFFASLLLVATTPLIDTARAEDVANVSQDWQAPTVWGAPFLPAPDHTSTVVQRAEILTSIDTINTAAEALRTRRGATETRRILESQQASLNRELASVPDTDLANPTEAFGIDIGAFPVVELRKPFRNDWNEPRSGGRRHRGTDLLAQIGVPLVAIEDGTFEQTTVGSLGGLSVYLLGDSGSRYYYAHLDEVEVMTEGQRVYAGQQIGTVGDSGNAKGSPHLHIQWAPNGGSEWENPFPLLDALYGDGQITVTPIEGPPNHPR